MRLLLLCFFCCCCRIAAAQPPAPVRVTLYNETTGINKGRVACLLQARSGYLWLGTTNGLLRFDGYSFKQITDTAISNTITRLAEDSSHQLWMSLLGGGLLRYEPASGRFTKYKVVVPNDPTVSSAETELIYVDSRNQLWLGLAQKGLIKAWPQEGRYERYDLGDAKTKTYSPALQAVYNSVYGIAEAKDEVLWLATHDGLYRFDERTKRPTAVRDASLQNGDARYDLFGSVYLAHDTLWFSAWAGGISRYAIQSRNWKTWLPAQQEKGIVKSNNVLHLRPKNSGELWCTAGGNGLTVFNKQTERFTVWSNNPLYPGVPMDDWNHFIVDKQQNLWAVINEGVVKLEVPERKFTFQLFPYSQIPSSKVMYVSDVLENESLQLTALLAAGGLWVHEKRSGKNFLLPVESFAKDETSEVQQLYPDRNGRLWVVARDWLYTYDFAANRLVKVPQPVPASTATNGYVQMVQDKRGRFWIATRRSGLLAYDVQTGRYTHYSKDSSGPRFLPAYYVSSLAVDAKGRIWLCSPFGFLGWTDDATGTVHSVEEDSTIRSQLGGTKSYALYSDKEGNVWAGTYYGLCFFDCRGEKPFLKRKLIASDGLRSNLAVTMEEDGAGNIWCLTEAALCRVRKTDFSVTGFDASEGLNWQGPVPRLKRKAGSDSLRLFGTNGWYAFLPQAVHQTGPVAPLVISEMTVNDQPYFFEEALAQNGRIDISPSQHVFAFEFAVLDFSKPAAYTYSYKLEGYDKDWIQSGSRRFASYTNLPGGDYAFRVRTANGQELRLPLFLQTPFTKKPLFFLLLAAVAGLLAYLYFRSRVAHHREVFQLHAKTETLQKEKATVMYDALKQQLNPHFLFNSLSSLSSLIEKDGKLANHFLEQLSNVYRYILKNRDKDLVPLGEELKFVSSYIELQKTRFKDGLQVTTAIDARYCAGRVAPVVLQNLVENAIKHNGTSAESPLVISIRCEDDYLIVQNNLQKKGVVETSNKQGLANLRTLYGYYTHSPITVEETADTFTIKIPLL